MDTGAINPLGASLAASMVRQAPMQLSDKREIIKAVEAVNKAEAFGSNQELMFGFDEDLKRPVLRIVDRSTGEVVAQVPPQSVLKMARSLVRPVSGA